MRLVFSTLEKSLGHFLYRIVVLLFVALLLYLGGKVTRKIFKAYRELFILWSVTFGRRWMPKAKSLRIQPYLCRTVDLDDVSLEECFRFHLESFRKADKSMTEAELFATYKKVLLGYTYVLFCREKMDGSLRGLSLMGVDHRGTHTLIKSGMLVIHKNYRGGPWIRLVLACLTIREMVLHPFIPVYHIGKLCTYKSYLLATPFPNSHPRYDKPAPEEYKKIAEDYIRSINVPIEDYNRETFVLHRRVGAVRERLASISERDLKNPHIAFFNDRNPGWKKGDQLVTLARMTWKSLLQNLLTVSLRQLSQPMATRGSGVPRGITAAGNVDRKKSQTLQSHLKRGVSFQDTEGTVQSIRYHSQHQEHDTNDDHDTTSQTYFIDRLYSRIDDEELCVEL